MLKSYKQLSRWYGALEPEAAAAAPEHPAAPDPDPDAAPPGTPLLSVDPADAVEGRRTNPEQPAADAERPPIALDKGAERAQEPPIVAEVVEPEVVEPVLVEAPAESVVIPAAGSEPENVEPVAPPPPVIDAEVLQVDSGTSATTPLDEIDDELKFPWEREAEEAAAAEAAATPRLRPQPPDPLDDADLFADADLGGDTVTPIDAHRGEREQWQGDDRFDNYVPSDVTAQRSEFVGGWSDWVGAGPPPAAAPGRDDDGTVRTLPGPLAVREQAPPTEGKRRRAFVVLGVAVLLLVLAAFGVVYLLGSGADRTGSAPVVPSAMQFSSAGGPAAECPAGRTPTEVRGAGRGGAMSGPDAILAFQYAYYVDRSGASARQLVAPQAAVSPAEVIQRGIDSIPAGTTHCVRITGVGDNRYSVEVTEQRPGGVPASYSRQTVTTAEIGGRTLITGIAAG
ncbi:hypothetical protein [Nocardia asteroides]|uniref:hypothetical protein n=1 Tax=Nocardia asteroides TaxID=1824 RepID=UPI001E60903F|nr:hypothetical protein [Nocardia asteroides]UGT63291.1 hypothetical protein LTT61_08250 [Nocardia asteroides]